MKAVKNIIRRLCGPAVLALLGLAIFTSASQAAKITFYVQVPGYSNLGWIQVVPGSNTGGRVVYSGSHGGYITDRASRGEAFCDVIEATTAAEFNFTGTCLYKVKSDRATLQQAQVRLPYVKTFTVPTNPLDDNVTVSVNTPSGTYAKRIPIGGR